MSNVFNSRIFVEKVAANAADNEWVYEDENTRWILSILHSVTPNPYICMDDLYRWLCFVGPSYSNNSIVGLKVRLCSVYRSLVPHNSASSLKTDADIIKYIGNAYTTYSSLPSYSETETSSGKTISTEFFTLKIETIIESSEEYNVDL